LLIFSLFYQYHVFYTVAGRYWSAGIGAFMAFATGLIVIRGTIFSCSIQTKTGVYKLPIRLSKKNRAILMQKLIPIIQEAQKVVSIDSMPLSKPAEPEGTSYHGENHLLTGPAGLNEE
ncbi:MAG: hypothetical protein JW795_19740, partial [Chitinivibrionales bacterium]|nr:hypothetical protein [Chitinivibrionales bacterium]